VTVLIAIPGQPTKWAPLPAGAVDTAIAVVDRLEREIVAALPGGRILHPGLAVVARWDEGFGGELRTWCSPALRHDGLDPVIISWRWGELWEGPDWYEIGWHPCVRVNALARRWRRAIEDALNPGKYRVRL
jgi:hypothetical protein